MVTTVRFRDTASGMVQLGLLEDTRVYNLTGLFADWTEPIAAWSALKALDMTPVELAGKARAKAQSVAYKTLQEEHLLLPPTAAQEVWAAGLTYERSRAARNGETKLADSIYDRVYDAQRPELFFKATGDRIVSPDGVLGLRSDSVWMVPEPELAVVITSLGEVVGWTLGNDLSSRDIEGENPLYLSQAKVFHRSCSIGPVLLWNTGVEQPSEWTMTMAISRGGRTVYAGSVSIKQMRRKVEDLVAFLLRDNPLPSGTVLLTGTGIVPPEDFTLQMGDVVDISVATIGTLRNSIGV